MTKARITAWLVFGLLTIAVAVIDIWSGPRSTSTDYPAKRIEVIVPFSPGGESDSTARSFELAIEKHRILGQPIVITNQPGAGGTIGSRTAKKADPDGYTILLLHDAILTAQYFKKADYGPEAFEPIAATGEQNLVLVVSKKTPWTTLEKLLEQSKKEGVIFGVNRGAVTHFVGLQLQQLVPGSKFTFPQSGSGADRFNRLLGGHDHVTAFSVSEYLQYRSEGLTALAIFAESRHKALPDVPTARESGIGISSSTMQMWWAPKGTSKKRIAVMADALEMAMKTKEVQQRMAQRHIRPVFLRGKALADRIVARKKEIADVQRSTEQDAPQLPLLVLICLGLTIPWVIVQGARYGFTDSASVAEQSHSPRRLLFGCGLLIGYALLLPWSGLEFRWLTIAFVPAMGLIIAPKLRAIGPLICLGTFLAFGLHYLFTHIVAISLP